MFKGGQFWAGIELVKGFKEKSDLEVLKEFRPWSIICLLKIGEGAETGVPHQRVKSKQRILLPPLELIRRVPCRGEAIVSHERHYGGGFRDESLNF